MREQREKTTASWVLDMLFAVTLNGRGLFVRSRYNQCIISKGTLTHLSHGVVVKASSIISIRYECPLFFFAQLLISQLLSEIVKKNTKKSGAKFPQCEVNKPNVLIMCSCERG